MHTPRLLRPVTLALVAGALLCPAVAPASGIDALSVGSLFSGPVTADAASLYWNPAQLVRLKRPELLGSLGLVVGSIGYTRDYRGAYQLPDEFELEAPVGQGFIDPSKSGEADPVSATPFSPTADAFFALPLHEAVGLGVGFFVPYAAPVSFDANGAQRFQLQEAFIAVTQMGGGLGIALHERVSVGAGVYYTFGTASITRIQDFGATTDFADALDGPPVNQPNSFGPDAPSSVRELAVLARPFSLTEATAHAVSFNVGVAFRPSDPVEVGFTYDHGADMDFSGVFALDMDDELFNQDLSSVGLAYVPLVEGDARLRFTLPKRIRAASSYTGDTFRLEGRVEWVKWSDLEAFYIDLESPDLEQAEFGLPPRSSAVLPRRWNDSVHIDFLGRFELSDTFALGGQVGYQSPASPDETIDVASPDGHRLIGGFVAEWAFTPGFDFLLDAKVQGILPRTVTTSDYDLGNGTYTLVLANVGAHFRVRFGEEG